MTCSCTTLSMTVGSRWWLPTAHLQGLAIRLLQWVVRVVSSGSLEESLAVSRSLISTTLKTFGSSTLLRISGRKSREFFHNDMLLHVYSSLDHDHSAVDYTGILEEVIGIWNYHASDFLNFIGGSYVGAGIEWKVLTLGSATDGMCMTTWHTTCQRNPWILEAVE